MKPPAGAATEDSSDLQPLYFGTDGIRGPIGTVIGQEAIARIAAGIAQYVRTPEYCAEAGLDPTAVPVLIVGGDTRATSDFFTHVAATVLAALGVRVRKCEGYVTTPMLAHAVRHEGAHGGLMITASHNPPDENGVKFIPFYGGPAMPAHTAAIEPYINGDPPDLAASHPGAIEPFNPAPAYAAALARIVDFPRIREAKLKICFDALFGASKGYVRQILITHDIPAQVLHGSDDPWMGKAAPDPTAARLAELRAQVTHLGFDLGLAADGDADRFAAVDHEGRFVSPNRCLAALAHYLYTYQQARGEVGRTISTTHQLDRIAAHHGFETVVCPVGFKHLGQQLRTNPRLLMAGEESGGFALRGHIPGKDGLLGCFLMLEALAVSGKSLAALLEEVDQTYGPSHARRLDWPMTTEASAQFLDRLAGQRSLSLDGVAFTRTADDRQEFASTGGAWVLVRMSGTEADVMRVYLEAESVERVEAMSSEMQALRETHLGRRL